MSLNEDMPDPWQALWDALSQSQGGSQDSARRNLRALYAAIREERREDIRTCWEDGNLWQGQCISDPEEGLQKAFNRLSQLTDDHEGKNKDLLEAYVANSFYRELSEAVETGESDKLLSVLSKYGQYSGILSTNQYVGETWFPQGAVDYTASDLNGDGVDDVYAVDADGNPHTVYGYNDDNEVESTVYSDYLRDTIHEGKAPQTWDEIVTILKAEGYDDEAIEEVRGSIKCLTEANEIQCGENDKFQGSVVLAGILNNGGYDGSWWDVRPTAGQPCQTDDGKQGEYDTNGGCVETEEPADGADCEYAAGIPGKIENGECTFTVGADCVEGSVPGTVDSEGKCDTGGDDPVDCIANPNDPECVDKSFQDYVDEVGEDIANIAKGIYDDFKDVITDCVGNPIDCIKQIGDKIAEAGIPEKCQDLKDCKTADPDTGTYCWKDCVNFNVLAGIPGLPQLPGMGEIDVGTYRDFEDFLKGIGKDIGDFIEDPAGTLEGWKDAVLKKVKEIFGDATDTKASDIIDWLKGIFGVYAATWIWGELEEEITNLLPVAPPVDGECPEDVSEINADNFEKCGYQDCGGGRYVKNEESCDDVENFDCSTVGRQGGVVQAGTEKQDENCGECLEGYEEDADGNCIEKEVPPECEGPTAEECTALHQEHLSCTDLEDASCGECLEGYTENDEGVCIKDDDGTYDPVCTEPRPSGALTFALQDQQDAWDNKCRETHCESGVPIEDDPDCYGTDGGDDDDLCDDGSEPFYINFDDDKDGAFTDPRDGKSYTYDPCDQTQPPVEVPGPDGGDDTCDNNAVNFDDCNDCGDGTTPNQHINDDCNEDLKDGDDNVKCPDPNQVRRGGIAGAACVTVGQVCFAEPSKYPGDSTTTNQGQYSTEGFCIDVSGGQCTNGNTPEYLPEDTDQDGAFFYDGDSVTYDPCADDLSSSMYFTPAPELVCNDQNADPPAGDDGGCGPCKSDYAKPEGYDVCTSIVDICAAQNVPGYGPDDAPCKDIDTTDPCTQADPNSQSDGQGGCECKQDFTPDLETGKCVPSKQDPQQCKDDDGNPTGATDYPDCVTCPTGQDFNEKGICVETTQPSEPCPDYNGAEGPRDAEGVCIDCEDPANAEICSGKLPPEVTCEDPNAVNDGELGECGPCKDLYDKPEGYDVCTSIETLCQQDEEYAKDNELCQGPCDDGKVEFIDENGEIFCDAPCAYNDQIASSSLDCVAPECANGATDYPDCVTCPSGQRINPETDKCEEVDCTDPANALFCGWVECDDGTMAPTLGDCEQETPCSDPEYAATHPLECGWVECPDGSWAKTRDECEEVTCENGATDYPDCTVCPEGSSMDAEGNCVDCSDCSCAEYAAANPEECITQPPVTPPPSGGGGGGGGGSMFDPFMAGISYTPQAVPEPPAPAQKDYMAELDNIIKRSLFEGMA